MAVQNLGAMTMEVIWMELLEQQCEEAMLNTVEQELSSIKKTRKKRTANPENWKTNCAKRLRNSGESYVSCSKSKKVIEARKLLPPCSEKCKLKCYSKISEEQRKKIFEDYWGLQSVQKQRDFLLASMTCVNPKYRYSVDNSKRRLNNAFHFEISEQKIRVCKRFFKATLGINDRPIRTVLDKKSNFTGEMISADLRGKHRNRSNRKVKENVQNNKTSILQVGSNANKTQQILEDAREYHDKDLKPTSAKEEPSSRKKVKKKRLANPENWKKNCAKRLRNSGESYTSCSKSKKVVEARKLLPPCDGKCKLECYKMISEEQRKHLFENYWGLQSVEKQRDFLLASMTCVIPKYRYSVDNSKRRLNNAFHFEICQEKIRVCKRFFKATLGINDRPIRTVLDKKTQFTGPMISADLRGKHKKRSKVADNILESAQKILE